MAQFDNVSVKKKANVYFDGRCVSHTVQEVRLGSFFRVS
jgi:uncharacterized protein YaiE (UPF0345 family)